MHPDHGFPLVKLSQGDTHSQTCGAHAYMRQSPAGTAPQYSCTHPTRTALTKNLKHAHGSMEFHHGCPQLALLRLQESTCSTGCTTSAYVELPGHAQRQQHVQPALHKQPQRNKRTATQAPQLYTSVTTHTMPSLFCHVGTTAEYPALRQSEQSQQED